MYSHPMAQNSIWKRFLREYLVRAFLLLLLNIFGCAHRAQIGEENEVTFHANLRPIDVDASTAERIGHEALQKIGYGQIINLAEQAGFVAYRSDVSIQLTSYGAIVPNGFLRVFSKYAVAAGVTSQADSPLPGPADIAAVGVVVIGLVDAEFLDGYLLNAIGGWLFTKGKINGSAGSTNVEFPSAGQLARKLGVSESQFHRQIKPGIVQDLAPEARKLGTKNPDIGVDSAGRVVLRNPKTGDTTITDVLLESYRP